MMGGRWIAICCPLNKHSTWAFNQVLRPGFPSATGKPTRKRFTNVGESNVWSMEGNRRKARSTSPTFDHAAS
jgi:hypothetical protein